MLAGSLLTSCSPSLLRRQTQGILIVTPLSGAAGRKCSSESLTNITATAPAACRRSALSTKVCLPRCAMATLPFSAISLNNFGNIIGGLASTAGTAAPPKASTCGV